MMYNTCVGFLESTMNTLYRVGGVDCVAPLIPWEAKRLRNKFWFFDAHASFRVVEDESCPMNLREALFLAEMCSPRFVVDISINALLTLQACFHLTKALLRESRSL